LWTTWLRRGERLYGYPPDCFVFSLTYLCRAAGGDRARVEVLVDRVRRFWAVFSAPERQWFSQWWQDAALGGPEPDQVSLPDPFDLLRAFIAGSAGIGRRLGVVDPGVDFEVSHVFSAGTDGDLVVHAFGTLRAGAGLLTGSEPRIWVDGIEAQVHYARLIRVLVLDELWTIVFLRGAALGHIQPGTRLTGSNPN
jgi:hypothetical protein